MAVQSFQAVFWKPPLGISLVINLVCMLSVQERDEGETGTFLMPQWPTWVPGQRGKSNYQVTYCPAVGQLLRTEICSWCCSTCKRAACVYLQTLRQLFRLPLVRLWSCWWWWIYHISGETKCTVPASTSSGWAHLNHTSLPVSPMHKGKNPGEKT